MKRLHTKGFTIIELLIATTTFSVVLLILTGAIVQFNKIYYRGNIDTKTQEAARGVAEDIARNIQFTSNVTLPTVNAQGIGYFCAGGHRYAYRLTNSTYSANMNKVIDNASIKHALVVDESSCGPVANIDTGPFSTNARELLGYNMQLVSLGIAQNASTYTVTVLVAYGTDYNLANNNCPAIRFGGHFCAFSKQEITVARRLN